MSALTKRHHFFVVVALALVGLGLPELLMAQGLVGVEAPLGTSRFDLVTAVRFIINGLLILAALAAMVFIIIGGMRYIFSQGDDRDGIPQAKNTIIFAVIGLVVIGLAAAVVNFVIGAIQAS